jgi:cell division protein FtsI (penicillin-binding protein 3)
MFLSMLLIGVSLFNIQVRDHSKYANIAKRQQEDSLVISAERGLISDRNGATLSFTRDDYSFIAYIPLLNKHPKNKNKIARKFSQVFSKTEKHYKRLLNSDKRFVYLEKKIGNDKALLLSDFVVDGLIKKADYTRIYPYENLASHILGYVNNRNSGLNGIEKEFDEYLAGQNGLFYVERDVLGNITSINDKFSRRALPGCVVKLTIDRSYQQILEEELAKGIREYKAESGIGILINPNNGEILALSNMPDFNPALYSKFSDGVRRNRAIVDPYEPGSTFKSISLAILLEEGKVNLNEKIDTENGTYRLHRVRINDTHKHNFLNVSEILQYSSNIGMAKLSKRLSEKTFYKYLRDFGFGNITSIDLPAESSGLLKKPDQYSKVSLPFMSFGYEILVTPLQLISAYAALINGGALFKPRIVKEIVDHEGVVVSRFDSQKIRNVIGEETSQKIRQVLINAVEKGTGSQADVDYLSVGGKTGTSQKYINSEYSKEKYNSSFVGFFPADNPKVLGLILLNSPSIGKFGGLVAAPIFGEIASRIASSDPSFLLNEDVIAGTSSKNSEDYLVNGKKYSGSIAQISLNPGRYNPSKTELYDSPNESMPDLIDLTKREAVAILSRLGVRIKIEGTGRIMYQSIKPGTAVKPGELCIIRCGQQNYESL